MAGADVQHQALADAWNVVATRLHTPVLSLGTRDASFVWRSHRSPWVWTFSALAGDTEIPFTRFGWGAASPEWMDYFTSISIPAALLCIIGIAICIMLVINLWCYTPKPTGEMPSLGPLLCTASLGFLGVWLAASMCIGRGTYTMQLMEDSLTRLEPDAGNISSKIAKMSPGFFNAAMWMSGWEKSCLGWRFIEPNLNKTIIDLNNHIASTLREISYTMYRLDMEMADVPKMVKNCKQMLNQINDDYSVVIRFVALLPTILASAIVLFIITVVYCEAPRGSNAAKLTDCIVLRLGALPIAVVIAFMTVLSAALLLSGISLGGFCAQAEQNTVNLVSAAQNGTRKSKIGGFASYYLTGHPRNNSVVQNLMLVQNIVQPLSDNMFLVEMALDLLGLWCHRVGRAELGALIREALKDIDLVLPLAKRPYLFSYYDEIVLQGVCGQFVGSIGWFMLCQIIAGMGLLPLIAVMSHRYLLEAAAAEENAGKLLDVEPADGEEGTAEESERLVSRPPIHLDIWNMACGRRNKVVVPDDEL